MSRFDACSQCNSWVEEKWWDCQPCPGAEPHYSRLHKMIGNTLTVVKETANYVVYVDDNDNESKAQRLLCIGGRHNGNRLTLIGAGSGYAQYNRGIRRKKGTPNKAVYIHESIL